MSGDLTGLCLYMHAGNNKKIHATRAIYVRSIDIAIHVNNCFPFFFYFKFSYVVLFFGLWDFALCVQNDKKWTLWLDFFARDHTGSSFIKSLISFFAWYRDMLSVTLLGDLFHKQIASLTHVFWDSNDFPISIGRPAKSALVFMPP